MPDLDHPKSYLGRRIPFISIPVSGLLGHRGITHSLIMVMALMALFTANLVYIPAFVSALVIGYLSHLFGDFLTRSGIPLLWPLRVRFRMPFFNFRTGSQTEFMVVALLAALAGFLYFGFI